LTQLVWTGVACLDAKNQTAFHEERYFRHFAEVN